MVNCYFLVHQAYNFNGLVLRTFNRRESSNPNLIPDKVLNVFYYIASMKSCTLENRLNGCNK